MSPVRAWPFAVLGLLLASSALGSGSISTPYVWLSGEGADGGVLARVDAVSGSVKRFRMPAGVHGAVDANGDFWLAGSATNKVYKVHADGRFAAYDVANPGAVAVDAAGNVFALGAPGRVTKLAGSNGAVLWATPPGTVEGPFAIAIDPFGDAWVTNANGGSVTKLDGGDGSVLGTYRVGSYPQGVAVDAAGDVWVTNTAGNSVVHLNTDGLMLGSFPVAGAPDGIAVDGKGNVWTANYLGNSATRLSPDGASATFPVSPSPTGVSIDAAGDVWIAASGGSGVTELDGDTGKTLFSVSLGLRVRGGYEGDLTGFALRSFVKPQRPKPRRREVARAAPSRVVAPSRFVAPPPAAVAPPSSPAPSSVDSFDGRGKEHPEDYALIVGIDGYRTVPHAAFGENDASVFKRYAQGVLGVPEENIILLLGSKASRTDVSKYLEEWLPRNVSKDSRVYFYYSGHGAPDPENGTAYLVPWDGDPEFLQSSAYPLTRLYDKLEALNAKEVVVFLDSCFSGAGGRSLIASNLRPLVSVRDAPLLGRKLSVLTAATGGEVAGSSDQQGHGLFTYYLLRGLQGAATPADGGHVNLDGLYHYVQKNVLKAAHRENREQHPKLMTSSPGLRLY